MKTLILILYMISGHVIEITDQQAVTSINSYLSHKNPTMWPTWGTYTSTGEICCKVNGCVTHINFGAISFIEEKWIDDKNDND